MNKKPSELLRIALVYCEDERALLEKNYGKGVESMRITLVEMMALQITTLEEKLSEVETRIKTLEHGHQEEKRRHTFR